VTYFLYYIINNFLSKQIIFTGAIMYMKNHGLQILKNSHRNVNESWNIESHSADWHCWKI